MNVRVWFNRNRAGHLDHYYHFLFGGLIPLHEWLVDRPSSEVTGLRLPPMGPMERHLAAVPSMSQLQLLRMTDTIQTDRNVTLRGMDGGPGSYRRRAIERFRNEILGSAVPRQPIDVLFVDRWRPTAEYLAQFPRRSEGAQRRSIVNASEVGSRLDAEAWENSNVQLELLTLGEQAALFHSARVIVGQHGAGLSNIIFARPDATLIEVAPARRRHYSQLCECLGIRYRYHGRGGRHITIRYHKLREQIGRMLENPPGAIKNPPLDFPQSGEGSGIRHVENIPDHSRESTSPLNVEVNVEVK